ncbi:hypothetical protein LDENG_00204930 [Lucifuga dentata]|nr:hypothetical protein LDENG_00204930 [Lucifuga dentata]
MEQHQRVSLYADFFKILNLQVKIGGSAYSRVYMVLATTNTNSKHNILYVCRNIQRTI